MKRFQKVDIKRNKKKNREAKEGRFIAEKGGKYLIKVDGERKLFPKEEIADPEFLKDKFSI